MRFAWAFTIALMITSLAVALSSAPHLVRLGMALAPGLLLAALIFPQGIHSTSGTIYLAVAALLNVLLLSLPIMWILGRVSRTYVSEKGEGTSSDEG